MKIYLSQHESHIMTEEEEQAFKTEQIEKLKAKRDSLTNELIMHAKSTNSDLIEVSIPLGWAELVCRLHESIKEIYPNYQLNQVKSKFGNLRYYVGPLANEEDVKAISALIRIAENTSDEICVRCGEPSEYRGDMMTTLCDSHYRIAMENKEALGGD